MHFQCMQTMYTGKSYRIDDLFFSLFIFTESDIFLSTWTFTTSTATITIIITITTTITTTITITATSTPRRGK